MDDEFGEEFEMPTGGATGGAEQPTQNDPPAP